MKYRIINTDITDFGFLYLEVKFTDTSKVVHYNDFIIGLPPIDACAQVEEIIEDYIGYLETHPVPADYRHRLLKLNHLGGDDPHGLKAKIAPIADRDITPAKDPKLKLKKEVVSPR